MLFFSRDTAGDKQLISRAYELPGVGGAYVQEPKDPRLRLRELERTRQQAIEQLSVSYGTVRVELQRIVAELDVEIAELKAKLANPD